MKVDVLGLQWGDERRQNRGRAHPEYDVVRFQGDPRRTPSSLMASSTCFTPPRASSFDTLNVVGACRSADLSKRKSTHGGLGVDGGVFAISRKAHLILPTTGCSTRPRAAGQTKIGSTLKGIDPTQGISRPQRLRGDIESRTSGVATPCGQARGYTGNSRFPPKSTTVAEAGVPADAQATDSEHDMNLA